MSLTLCIEYQWEDEEKKRKRKKTHRSNNDDGGDEIPGLLTAEAKAIPCLIPAASWERQD